MADRRTPIQVPPRADDEAPASPEQLQLIRQLVTGMSLTGFRFDYRRLGTAQAASITDQLLQMRDASNIPSHKAGGSGCIGALVRGAVRLTVTLIVFAVVLAGVAGGGYLIYQKINETPGDVARDNADDRAGDEDGHASATGEREKSKMFDGLYVEDDPRRERDTNNDADDPELFPDTPTGTTPRPRPRDPRPDVGTPAPEPKPSFSAEAKKQWEDLELMLAQLKTYTRSESEQNLRAVSVQIMQQQLTRLSAVMEAIASADPALAQRVRRLVARYGDETIDGRAMRNEIDAIREQVDALIEAS
ncbi:MAG: hypothetical protein ACE37H_18580 [Phycisphaeraceae bacterium]